MSYDQIGNEGDVHVDWSTSRAHSFSGDDFYLNAMTESNRKLFEQDSKTREWLAVQPGMNPWDHGCQQLLLDMDSWLFRDSTELCETPVTPSTHTYSSFLERLWVCLSFHWQEAAKLRPLSGRAVAEALRAGISPANGGKLGGDPLRDAVWVEAILQGDARAISRFNDEYAPRAKHWARQVNFDLVHDLSWWQDTVGILIGGSVKPGSLASFAGESSLELWLRTVVRRTLIKESKKLRLRSKGLKEYQREATIQQPTSADEETISADCWELFSRLLQKILSESSRNERLVTRLLIVEGLKGTEVAKVLRINKGNVSRTFKRVVERVQAEMGLLGGHESDAFEIYRQCLEHVFDSNDGKALHGLMQRVLSDLAHLELPS